MKNFKEQEINPGEPGYFLYDDESACPSFTPGGWSGGWSCTRSLGHPMPHAAHTSDGQQQATWEDGEEDPKLSEALSDLKKANEETARSRQELQNRLDSIHRSRSYITSGLGELRRELSFLPNSAPDFAPDNAVEWHAALRVLEDLLSVVNSAWQTADHHISSHIHNLEKDVEAING